MEKEPKQKNSPDLSSELVELLAAGESLEMTLAKKLLNKILNYKEVY